jgi:hypothetical protein
MFQITLKLHAGVFIGHFGSAGAAVLKKSR